MIFFFFLSTRLKKYLVKHGVLVSDEDSWAQYESCEESDGGNGSGGEDNGEQFDATLPSRHVVSIGSLS